MARNREVTNGEAPTGMTVDAVRDVAMKALLNVAADKQAPAAARAGASRTLLEAIGIIGRNQDLGKLDEKRAMSEMTPDEIDAEIQRLAKRAPKPRLRKLAP